MTVDVDPHHFCFREAVRRATAMQDELLLHIRLWLRLSARWATRHGARLVGSGCCLLLVLAQVAHVQVAVRLQPGLVHLDLERADQPPATCRGGEKDLRY
jgi:hypothetical protein